MAIFTFKSHKYLNSFAQNAKGRDGRTNRCRSLRSTPKGPRLPSHLLFLVAPICPHALNYDNEKNGGAIRLFFARNSACIVSQRSEENIIRTRYNQYLCPMDSIACFWLNGQSTTSTRLILKEAKNNSLRRRVARINKARQVLQEL